MGGRRGDIRVRKARITVANINAGANADGQIAVDTDTNQIPNRIKILRIVVHPSANTVYRLRIFSTTARIADPTNALYSLVYSDDFSYDNNIARELIDIEQDIPYIDEDGNNTIYTNMAIAAGSVAASFIVDIYYSE